MLLLGREAELARLEELLGEARRGGSGCLLIHGEAGVGKSALLQYAAEQATDMTVLSARGLQSESDLAFAGLADLVRPVQRVIDRIPSAQAAALAGALALGPAVPGDRFAVYAATLSLLASVAEASPVLAIVDDLHWLDSSSAEALLFVARRLGKEGVALLLAK